MFDSERQLGIIVDLILPLDFPTRYDIYFTDARIAIVCMGKSDRAGETLESRPLLFGITPAAPVNRAEEIKNKQKMEEQIKKLSLVEKLKLSKKSCFYTYSEIEEVKLVAGKKPKFVILSKDCVSKFAPNEEQFRQLIDLLPTIEMLKSKFSIFGNFKLNSNSQRLKKVAFSCKYCGYENDLDAVFCQMCGNQLQAQIPYNPSSNEISCVFCGAKNKMQALFCKKCGKPNVNNQTTM
jgi:ribosomal protein L40E